MREYVAVLAPMQFCQALPSFFLDFSASDEVDSSVATCCQAMHQLRELSTFAIDSLTLLQALGDRDCPLEHVTVEDPPWVCTIFVDKTDDAML